MPRVSVEHEEAVRRRILEAASGVLIRKGFHETSIQDVVRESGMSVGAIYTYFRGKDDLLRATCLAAVSAGIDALIADLQGTGSVREKIDRAISIWSAGPIAGGGAPSFLVQAWAAAPDEPAIRDLLLRRRERLVTVTTMLLAEAVRAGEARADLDVDAVAVALSALLDGISLARAEEPDRFDRRAAERPLRAILDLLYTSGGRPAAEGPAPPEATQPGTGPGVPET
ncbi:MAG: TetR/AcrR family transcriptional regulator [Candidatus Limnocylindrales bacterium]